MVVAPSPLPAERREVVLAQQVLRSGVHRVEVERMRPAEHVAALQRVHELRLVGDPVGVAPPHRGEPGVEAGRSLGDAVDADVGTEDAVEPAAYGVERRLVAAPRGGGHQVVASRSTWATWPRACTPVSVRPATVSAAARRAQHRVDRLLEVSLNGAQPGLLGPAVEAGAVVGEVDSQPHRDNLPLHAAGSVWDAARVQRPSSRRLALLLFGLPDPRHRRGDAAHRGPRLGRLLHPGQRPLDRWGDAVPRRQHRDQRGLPGHLGGRAGCGPGSARIVQIVRRGLHRVLPAARAGHPRVPWSGSRLLLVAAFPVLALGHRGLPRHPPGRRPRGGRRPRLGPAGAVPLELRRGAGPRAPWSAGCSAPRSDRGPWR